MTNDILNRAIQYILENERSTKRLEREAAAIEAEGPESRFPVWNAQRLPDIAKEIDYIRNANWQVTTLQTFFQAFGPQHVGGGCGFNETAQAYAAGEESMVDTINMLIAKGAILAVYMAFDEDKIVTDEDYTVDTAWWVLPTSVEGKLALYEYLIEYTFGGENSLVHVDDELSIVVVGYD